MQNSLVRPSVAINVTLLKSDINNRGLSKILCHRNGDIRNRASNKATMVIYITLGAVRLPRGIHLKEGDISLLPGT